MSFRKHAMIVFAASVAMSAAIAAVCIILHTSSRSEVLGRLGASESGRVRHQAAALRDNLRRAVADLKSLVASEATRRFLDDPSPKNTKAIQDYFLLTAGSSGLYDQIRIINSNGMETVRINYNSGSPTIVGHDVLQDKKDRYYFRDAVALKPEEVSISKFDLNVERGKIERPPKPTLRFASPLFDSGGERKGVLVLNYLGQRLLDRFSQAAFGQGDIQAMLLDMEGYWLKGPRRADEWGFMFKNARTFAWKFPRAWDAVLATESGMHHGDEGLFFFETIRPPDVVMDASGGRSARYCRGSRFWKVVSFVPDHTIALLAGTDARTLGVQGGLLTALVWLIGLVLIRSRLQDDRYVRELQFTGEALASANESLQREMSDRTSEIRRRLAQKDAFIARLGNGLMAPLTPMASLLGELRDHVDETSAEALDRAMDSASNMTSLVDDTLVLAQLNTPGFQLELSDADLLVETRNITAVFRGELDDNSISVDNRIGAPVTVCADKMRIRDVLHRIISNCITYMNPSGTIVIEARAANSNMVTLSISDTGRGMTPSEISHAFDEFYRADPSRQEASATGLGLAICRRIVEMHNGKIWIQSAGPQQGTTVFLMLPAARQACVR